MSLSKAPIDPNQLLAAFAPLLTPTGGIKNATEVPRLSSLMTKFSRKLVSRCVYCNVLLATSPDVLEEFLKSGGWKTIDGWIQLASDSGNKPFLNELCDLLLKLPMNVERLREENIKTPKIIKKLSKSDDPILAEKSKQIVAKWKKMIELASGVTKEVIQKDHKKKRKKDGSDSANNSDSNSMSMDSKKPRIMANVVDVNNTDSNLSIESNKSDETSKSKADRTPRPSTAKVKPGKSRLQGLVSSQTNSKAITKPRKESPNVSKINKLNINSIEVLNSLPITSTKVQPKAIEIKATVSSPTTPTPLTIPIPPVVTPPAIKHVLQDSTSFMDALIAPPTSSMKKKRRPSASTGAKDSTNANSTEQSAQSSPNRSPPKAFSFYKDMIDEKVDQRTNNSESNQNDDNEDIEMLDIDADSEDRLNDDSVSGDADEESNHMNVDIVVPDISVETLSLTAPPSVISDRSSQKIKPILCYIKKGTKKSVRWVEDSHIQAVKYFDLDETERVNVTRPPGSTGYGDLKRYDMKHEAEFMLMARRSANTFDVADDYLSRAETFSPWKLIPCDGDTNVFEVGKDSKERLIQADRMRTTLETFYMRHQIPETPLEPEAEIFMGEEQPKIIPLEDDNNPNNCHDFSNVELPQPKTGEILPPRLPDLSKTVPINAFGAGIPFGGQPSNPVMGLPGQTPFNSQQIIPPFAQNLDPFVAAPQPQPFFPSNNGPPPFQQPWADSNSGPPPHAGPPPPNYRPRFNHVNHAPPRGPMGNRPPRLPRNAQNTVCRHFARTGKCRFQPKCNFLHTNDR